VTCCVKIQNDCSKSFETRQGLRQGDVLSTLLFNVVLEVIVRRANLQRTGIIYNKDTQLPTRNDRTIRDVEQSVATGDKHFEVGSLMTPTDDVSLEIQRRIQTANRSFFGQRKHLQSSYLSRQIKFTIHKTLIRPVLLCGSETWVLTKREENRLIVFEKKVLRTIAA
jgi:hypothetical protein